MQAAEHTVLASADFSAVTSEAQSATVQRALAAARQRQRSTQMVREDDTGRLVRARPALPRPTPVAAPRAAQPAGIWRVPILMYHHIADAPPGADAVRRDLSVSPGAFARQMDYLRTNGYQVVSLAYLAEAMRNGKPLPAQAVVLTFDDGYDDNYTQAYPILQRSGFVGTFFIIADFVGQPGYASWGQVVEMSQHAMDIESHGRTHADLAISSAADATWQVSTSRSMLEEKLGQPVRLYCYPSGRYTAQTISILRNSGYVAAVTTSYGATHAAAGLFELARVRIRGLDTLEQFIAKLQTAP